MGHLKVGHATRAGISPTYSYSNHLVIGVCVRAITTIYSLRQNDHVACLVRGLPIVSWRGHRTRLCYKVQHVQGFRLKARLCYMCMLVSYWWLPRNQHTWHIKGFKHTHVDIYSSVILMMPLLIVIFEWFKNRACAISGHRYTRSFAIVPVALH